MASLADITADPWLIDRAGWRQAYVRPIYTTPGDRTSYPIGIIGWAGHDLALTLRPKESIEFRWAGFGPRFEDGSIESVEPVPHANGTLTSQLDAADAKSRQWLYADKEVTVSTGVPGFVSAFAPSKAGTEAEMFYRVSSPWPLVDGELDLEAFVGHRRNMASIPTSIRASTIRAGARRRNAASVNFSNAIR